VSSFLTAHQHIKGHSVPYTFRVFSIYQTLRRTTEWRQW